MKPPILNKKDPSAGPIRKPKDVETSATATFYSTEVGYSSGI